jgi:preprotein translocase subunit SecE
MARNRQRAKERQAARRAARQAEGQGQQGGPLPPSDEVDESVDLSVGAPPHDLGHSDAFLEELEEEDRAADDLEEAGDRELELEAEEAGAFSDEPVEEIAPESATGPRGVRGGDATPAVGKRKGLGRVWEFLQNVWAELQRVQWPNRKQVTTLTGVVLGFVLIAGGYLGLLDAIFSRVIDQIL